MARRRVRKVAKWAGVVACVLIAGTWVFSCWGGFAFQQDISGEGYWSLGIHRGALTIARWPRDDVLTVVWTGEDKK